jgi:hypothetical protein
MLAKPAIDNVTAVTSLISTTDITTVMPTGSGSDSAILLPGLTTFRKSNNTKFDPTTLSAADVPVGLVQGMAGNAVVLQALQWGINGSELSFDTPLTIRAYVGDSFDGQTLYIYRSSSLAGGWGTDGIFPAACQVSAGYCVFQSTKSAYFAIVQIILPSPTPTATPAPTGLPAPTSASSPSSSNAAAGPSATPAPQPQSFLRQVFNQPQSLIPQILRVFYADENGKLPLSGIFTSVKTWVESWRATLLVEIYGGKESTAMVAQNKVKCDINNDDKCDLKDLSILLYYVGK